MKAWLSTLQGFAVGSRDCSIFTVSLWASAMRSCRPTVNSGKLLSFGQEQSAYLDKEKRGLEGIQAALAEKQADFEKVIENKDLSQWRKDQSMLTAQKDLLAKAAEAARNVMQSRQTFDELSHRQTTVGTLASELAIQLKDLVEKQAAGEKEAGPS